MGWYFDKRMVEMQGVKEKVAVYIVDNKPSESMEKCSKNYHMILKKF